MAITVAQIRAVLQDPTGADEKISDAEYQLIIDFIGEDKPFTVISVSALALSAKYAEGEDVDVGPISVDDTKTAENYLKIAEKYQKMADQAGESTADVNSVTGANPVVTGISISDMQKAYSDTDRYPESFFRGVAQDPEVISRSFYTWINGWANVYYI